MMNKRDLKIFVIQKNPYHYQSLDWYEKLDNKKIIHLTESEYYKLDKYFNLWKNINEELSEETGYMGGPTIWEDTWINNKDELCRVKQKINSLIKNANLSSKDEINLLSKINKLVDMALENGYWLVFDF